MIESFVGFFFSFLNKAAPYWILAPQNLVLSPGEDGSLICRANGNPKPRISWLLNGVPIESKFPRLALVVVSAGNTVGG